MIAVHERLLKKDVPKKQLQDGPTIFYRLVVPVHVLSNSDKQHNQQPIALHNVLRLPKRRAMLSRLVFDEVIEKRIVPVLCIEKRQGQYVCVPRRMACGIYVVDNCVTHHTKRRPVNGVDGDVAQNPVLVGLGDGRELTALQSPT